MRQQKEGVIKTKINPAFIHLRVHSAYSLLEGALKIDKIITYAQQHSAPAIAVTDSNNLFGALEFSQKAVKAGVQPIIGCKLSIDFNDEGEEQGAGRARFAADYPAIILLAASDEGYANLVRLVSRAYLDKDESSSPHIEAPWLEGEGACGLIILTGGFDGPVNRLLQQGKAELAASRLDWLSRCFGNRLYVEMERHGRYDKAVEAALVDMAYDKNLPLVATNEAFFLNREDYEAHDALLAVAAGQVLSVPDRHRVTPDHYLKTEAEMTALFADIPEALANTVEIARRCHVCAPARRPILPSFVDSGRNLHDSEAVFQAEAKALADEARLGLTARLQMAGPAPGYSEKDYQERLDYEISVIIRMRFPGYFLIVADFIKWAKARGIPVGPGRGSGAGSLVAYALTITDIDPLRFSLLFERFLNPDRVSMPDFDIDFCQDRREEVIHYVQRKYGSDQVAQIITFGTLQARAVLRDVGRVLEMPYGQVDRLSKLVPSNPANPVSLARAVSDEPKFAEEKQKDALVGRLLDIAQKLEGLYRHASTHAAGIVIGDRPLSQLVPMYRDPRSDMAVTQFNMKYVEQAGLVKFDFLGLKTLTILQTAVDFLKKRSIDIDLSHIPLDDAATYAMLSRGETVGVFQVESAGMRKALIGMKPDRIEDIIALVALYRPGPMENIPTYNARKNGEEEITSVHPLIDPLLKETQGVIVYQEQVMQIAQLLSGYSLGEADLLRRAMGKKIRAEMDKQRTRFVDGAVRNAISEEQANVIFDLLAKFADYGFNKSHAAAYALVSYQTAWLKAHYPVEFLAASMTYDMSNTDRLNDFRHEAKRLGIEIVLPSVQSSGRPFVVGDRAIYYALAAIKGVGEAAADHIVAARGLVPFKTLEDFCERTDPRLINRRVWESLIQAGAFDSFGVDREVLMAGLDSILAYAQRLAEDKNNGQVDIFAAAGGFKDRLTLPLETERWSSSDRLHREFQTAGFYLSAHPLDEYEAVLAKKRVQTYAVFAEKLLNQSAEERGYLAGTVIGKQIRKTRTGNKMGIVQLSDNSGFYELPLFSEELERWGDRFEPGAALLLQVRGEKRDEDVRLQVQSVESLSEAAEKIYKKLTLYLSSAQAAAKIADCLGAEGAGCEVECILTQDEGGQVREYEFSLGRYAVKPHNIAMVEAFKGVVETKMVLRNSGLGV
ncbi:DNA polymerase III subunit alpha [Candidatus Tokpelaia sp.]|uniref:DNA polymerase III subunit alpha n=1 Tax=Candidatus Tokpelaia sp. TaxID=2233777 RepID=UPI00123A6D56|nr:DNA polymerase III subunit alpha [Candidatus Tokpelaia sp.]KAA6404989.1 DNA polymerase III subunit alpha [Candidatus Tokpelaia sp.]